ncbi:hypothetical protein [Erwinia rhapontici]|uniref:hypothetical protein n=1 Tax=Erwinia rhapontici TaxID=55212 RepID=UPI00133175B4|nr:hypothetical protein [Erwinia rhapontici]MBP2157427.1 hypothetical protein [Erwinia rhapontici]
MVKPISTGRLRRATGDPGHQRNMEVKLSPSCASALKKRIVFTSVADDKARIIKELLK